MICLRCFRWLAVLVLGGALVWATARPALAQIRPYEKNPAYWQYRGRPVLLFGGSDRDNIFHWAGQGDHLREHLELLSDCGGNYIRCTLSSREYTPQGYRWDLLPYPFAKSGDKYDLTRWNDEYWANLRTFLKETQRRGIIVQLEIWDRWNEAGDSRKSGNGWYHSPWNPNNNVNYDWSDSPLLKPGKTEFYNRFHLAAVTKDSVLLPHQQRFVRRIIDEVLAGGFDHVLFQIDNESGIGDDSLEPDPYWARFLREYAHSVRPGHPIYVCTSRRFHWPAPHLSRRFQDWSNPEIRVPILDAAFNYCDISQNNGSSGQQHYDNLLWYRAQVHKHGARPINNVKCYHFNWPVGAKFRERRAGTDAEAGAKFWRAVFAGAASIRFHRSTTMDPVRGRDGFGLTRPAERHLRSLRNFVDAVELFSMTPHNDLLFDRADNEAYCLAETGRQYAVFFTGDGDRTVRLDVGASHPDLTLRWLDIRRSRWSQPATLSGEPVVSLTAPGAGHYIAVMLAR